ncbi:MAG: biliverdin-producing heme oxygenase [Phycisphaerales bacterium]
MTTAPASRCPFAKLIPGAAARPPISERLKTSTRDLHTAAETHPIQADLVAGRATPGAYAAYLSQMHHLHEALDAALLRLREIEPRTRALFREHHLRARHASADVAALGHTLAGPTPATVEMATRLANLTTDQAPTLLGALYVLEGSTNGGLFIAAAIRKTLNIAAGAADTYLNPHGDQQRPRWAEFKTTLDGLTLNPAEDEALIEGAGWTFRGITRIFDDLSAAAGRAA